MRRPRDPARPTITALESALCAACGFVHAKKCTVTSPEFAALACYSVSTIHSYRSRGMLPKAIGRPGGNPRWSTCVVMQFINGVLPSDQMDTPKKPGSSGRRS
jgi:hypothetical protein